MSQTEDVLKSIIEDGDTIEELTEFKVVVDRRTTLMGDRTEIWVEPLEQEEP